MPIPVTCQACGQSFQLRDELAGRTVRCRCGQPVTVPDPSAGVLSGLLEEELNKPFKRPPQRDAPEFTSPSNKPSSTPAAPAATAASLAADGASGFRPFTRVALRSIVGVMGLTYGLSMVALGGLVAVYFFTLMFSKGWAGFSEFPWPLVLLVMIAVTGLLLSVASVGVLIAKQTAGPKARFAAGMLVVLWIAHAALAVVILIRLRVDVSTSVSDWNWDFWRPLLILFARTSTWAIVPLLCYVWCVCCAKRDLDQ